MTPKIFLVRVDPKQWQFKKKKKDWGGIDEGDWVPFGPLFEQGMKKGDYLEWKDDINQIKTKDIIIGYSCYNKKYIEALGRIISDKFSCDGGKSFLIQKTTQLKQPIYLTTEILESEPKLKANQPAVTLISGEGWEKIKSLILNNNSELIKDIEKLESGSDDWYSESG